MVDDPSVLGDWPDVIAGVGVAEDGSVSATSSVLPHPRNKIAAAAANKRPDKSLIERSFRALT